MSFSVASFAQAAAIPHYYGFKYLLNPKMHEKIFEKINLRKKYGDFKQLEVLDLYPGPAQHSAVFNNLFKPKTHVLMEHRNDFAHFIEENYSNTPLKLYKKDPYDWLSYRLLIEKDKWINPLKQERIKCHDKLFVMGNVTNARSEILIMQWLACIGYQNWIQRFGLVNMLLWMPTSTAIKLLAKPKMNVRAKCSLVTEAFTNSKLIAINSADHLRLYHPSVVAKDEPIIVPKEDFQAGRVESLSLVELTPKTVQMDLDNWDFVTKHLMVLKKTPLRDAFESIGHGASEYFCSKIEDEAFLDQCPGDLTAQDFCYLASIFESWPFKPDIYMDFIDLKKEDGSV